MSANGPFLSPTQRKLAGYALALTATAVILLIVGVTVVMLLRLLGFFANIIWPLAVAGIVALVLRPVIDSLQQRLKIRRAFAVALLFAFFMLATTGLLIVFLPPVVNQTFEFIASLPDFWHNAIGFLQSHYPAWVQLINRHFSDTTIHETVNRLTGEINGLVLGAIPTIRQAGERVLDIFAFLTSLALIPIYLFFFMLGTRDPARALERHLGFLGPNQRQDILFLAHEFISIVVSFFRGQLIIALIMGLLFAMGFTIVGLRFGLALGLLFGLLNIVPYLGTILGLSIILPMAFLQSGGGWVLVLKVLVTFLIVHAIESWLLTPRIMGKRTGLHPLIIILAIVFWGTVFHGILGMVLAVPLTAFLVTFWRLIRQKYLLTVPSP